MKLVYSITICVFLLALVLSACDSDHYDEFSLKESDENIVSAEIVNVPDDGMVSSFNFSSVDAIYTIPEDKLASFIKSLHEMPYTVPFGDPLAGINGKAIRINYQGGSFELIGRYYSVYSDNAGQFKQKYRVIDITVWDAFIGNWETST